VLLLVLGLSSAAGSNTVLMLTSDTHQGRQAAASAGLNFTKCPIGATAVAVVNPLIQAGGS
jgi:hypothetical protein